MAKKKSARKKAAPARKSKAKAASFRKKAKTALMHRARASYSRKAKQASSIRSAKKETFTLDYPKPESAFRDRMIAPPEERLDVQPQAPTASKSIARKKEIPRVATALIGAALVSLVFAVLFVISLGVDIMLSLALSIPLFVGFSILIYNLLEGKQ
ncbi:Uncharacterised protein [uncultured archaeon]|nr:Uncharacterised protein [uncultured archaeon]